MAGRRPKPTALKVLLGNPGKRPLNKREPRPAPGLPVAPDYMSENVRKAWDELFGCLAPMRVLTTADRESLAMLADMLARYREANAQLQRTGLLIKAPSGYPMLNPLLSVVTKAAEQFRLLAAEFGLTPSSRSRLNVAPETPEEAGAHDPIKEAQNLLVMDGGKD